MKGIINKAKIGLTVFASAALLAGGLAVAPVYAAGTCDTNAGLGGAVSSDCSQGQNTPTNLFGDGGIVTTVINTMLFIVGILSVIMIIYAGIRYTTAHGDKSQVEGAKSTLMYAIVGLIVSIIAYAVVNWVVSLWSK